MVWAALVVALLSSPAQQGRDYVASGNGLLASCDDRTNSFATGMCLGFITGVQHEAIIAGFEANKHTICQPDGVTNGQTLDVVMQYLRAHPKTRHLAAAHLVREALREAWPCK